MGTEFKPIKFSLDEPQKTMFMCGCKLSHKAPFCDGKTCISLLQDANKALKPTEAAEPVVPELGVEKSAPEEQAKSL